MRSRLLFFVSLFLGMCVAMLVSCSKVKDLKSPGTSHSVVVIHSWDSIGEEKELFSKCMDEAFRKYEMEDVEIHHIYAAMVHRPAEVFSAFDWAKYAEQIREWKPEVILLNDDPIVDWLLTQEHPDSIFLNTPVVFAGVNTLLADSLSKFQKMTGFEARIDLARNIEELMRMGRSQSVLIELDYGGMNDRLRAQFEDVLRDSSRFVNNSDFHVRNLDADYLEKEFPGLAVVSMVSCAEPYKNVGAGESDMDGKAVTERFYRFASSTWHLQVKYDIFSNSLMDHAGKPQFTCIREQFGDPKNPMFLGGYFTSTEIQVDDQVRYAVSIMKGETPKSLPISMHASDYYLDWNAVQMTFPHVPYSAYSSKYHVVNTPFYLENPVMFVVEIVGIALIILAVIYLIVFMMVHWKRRGQNQLLEELQYEEKVHDLMFSDTKDTLWEFYDGVFTLTPQFSAYFNLPSNNLTIEELEGMVHQDSRPSLEFFKGFREQRGRKVIRLQLSPDGGTSWYWTEVTYTVTEESARSGKLYGLLMNIDQKKETEEQLEQAQLLASEVALKENFLANISHDLRTPLGAVTGFSTLLTTPGMTFEEGEREMYGEVIHQNTDMILNMIDSVMQKAQIETGDLEIIQKPVSVGKLVQECYNTNHIIAPTHLQFNLEMSEPDADLNIDITRTKQVVNNFLSNAFKFTTEGSVTLGWRYMEDDPEQIEVYVRDTGIGVAPEKQAQLFERYIKVNETDKGTGLGLNISKTIMEKQGGTIGVESELGKGSKFFFRLSRFVQCLVLSLLVCGGVLLPSSCLSRPKGEQKPAKVLVFHGYEENYSAYKDFDDDMMETFISKGINADMHHVYLGLGNPVENTDEKYLAILDSIKNGGWIPDIVMTEGDRAAADFLQWQERGMGDELNRVPVVFGGVHHPEWEKIRRYNNIVVISDPIDYCTNINLAVEMSGKNCVEIELDYFKQDSLIRKELKAAIARPPYMDNSDFHIQVQRDEQFSNEWRDSVMVLVYSTESPERNTSELYNTEDGYANLRRIFIHSWLYPSVAVKRDVFSSSIADKTGRPQFTAVKAGFADGEGRYLCGYFAGYKTVAQDLAKVASDILHGADLASFVGITHEKNFYMDYQAMKTLGMDYNDYKDRFIIVGAPQEVTMPLLTYGTWTVIILVFLVAAFSILLVLVTWKSRTAHDLMEGVRRRAELRSMALRGADSHNVRSEVKVKEIISYVHPDYAVEVPLIRQAIDIVGSHSYEIYCDVERDGHYRWWQLRFVVIYDNKTGRKNVEGILINIDETKKYEEALRKAMNLAEEARQKENFLTTISHEIRTPLNAVVGFSDLVVSMPADSFTPEEMEEYAKIIKANNTSLSAMIENILMFSRIESGRIQYVKNDFDAVGLVQEIGQEWQDLIPQNVKLHVIAVSRGVVVHNDRERVKYILNQMVSNAIKFTEQGDIVIGMAYHLNTDKAEFFVEDTGCGIPKEKQSVTFGLFWKDNGFIPGLGLGLNVAKKLADGMGLELGVESKVGFGSRFFLLADADTSKNSVQAQVG